MALKTCLDFFQQIQSACPELNVFIFLSLFSTQTDISSIAKFVLELKNLKRHVD